MTLPQSLQLVSTTTAFASALFLYWGSLGVPWKMQSWSGESPAEISWKRKRKWMIWVGIPCACIAFGCQIWAILIGS